MTNSVNIISKQKISNFFFTSDTHYGHANIIKYCDRPFKNQEEHDNMLINNHNSIVGPKDYVIHLGDFAFGKKVNKLFISDILNQLNGKIIIVFGNHDKYARSEKELFFKFYDGIYEQKIGSKKIVCCHYPLLSWNSAFYGKPHIFGHVHSGPKKYFKHQPNSYDVGVDNNNFMPISYENLILKLEESKKLPLIK